MTIVSIVPEQFTLVEFDAERVKAIAAEVAKSVAFPSDVDIHIEVDEVLPAPLNSSQADYLEGRADLWFTGGAFEDTHKGRNIDEVLTRCGLGASLLRVKDRISGGFEDAPNDSEISERQRALWDAYADGRLTRIEGFVIREPRRRYVYRLECGFNDVADAAYDQLWASDATTWADLLEIEARLIEADPTERGAKPSVRRISLRQTQ